MPTAPFDGTSDSTPSGPVVDGRGLDKVFESGPRAVHALRSIDVTIDPGRLVAIHGRSGSGKTTLLNVLGGLERVDAGSLTVAGQDLVGVTDDELARFRRDRIAFVFQNFGLIDVLTAAENVGLVLRSTALPGSERHRRVSDELARVGLSGRDDHVPSELSGGEQQRVAVARALASDTGLVIADEPTAQLDVTTGALVVDALRAVVAGGGATVIVATHDPALIAAADVAIEMVDGALVG